MSWDLLFGFANEVNFGPTFLIGLGAYSAVMLDNRFGLPIPVCVALGTLAAVVGGVVLALPALRMSGPYFGLTTLVAVLLLQNLVVVFAGLTGGEIGLTVPDVISISGPANYGSRSPSWWRVAASFMFCRVRPPASFYRPAARTRSRPACWASMW